MDLSAFERMTRLVGVTAALSKTMTHDEVSGCVLSEVLAAAGARGGALLTIDDEKGEYVLTAREGGGTRETSRLPLDSAAAVASCARSGRASQDGGLLCLPLLVRGHAIGAFAIDLGEMPVDADRAFLEAVADQCAQALERSRLYALEQMRREELERSNRLKDDFLGIVSHELRTPLSAILGWARMLKRGIIAPDARERALGAIERNAVLQARLVDDLLDVSRIVTGKLDLEMTTVDVASVIDAALDSVRPTLLVKGIDVRLQLAAGGASVLGDARRLQQVVWNILSNAIKFTSPGGRIEVRLERDLRVARVVVKDSGIGIPPEVLPHVFERFAQADNSATRQHGGLGLGLSIVRHVVEAHGGTAMAASEGLGKGATLVVELPLTDVQFSAPMRAAEVTFGRRLEGMRVLLVDDDADTREFLAAALEGAGAQLRAVASAAAAIDEVRSWRPDVIVSDIAMPEEDGYAFIRRVRSLEPAQGGRTPAVALTALARPRDRVRALAAGFQTHMPKPVDPGELVLAVANLRPT